MSRLGLKSLGITSVSKSIDTLTFFFYPGEGKRSSKGVVSYKRKKEGKTEKIWRYRRSDTTRYNGIGRDYGR